MAQGTPRTVPVQVEKVDGVTLELTDIEARVLMTVLRKIAGVGPIRDITDGITDALEAGGTQRGDFFRVQEPYPFLKVGQILSYSPLSVFDYTFTDQERSNG